jgi:hypothetical protein
MLGNAFASTISYKIEANEILSLLTLSVSMALSENLATKCFLS